MFKIRNHFSDWYQPHDNFVVRTPLFPVIDFFNWTASPGDDIETWRAKLRQFYLRPVAQEALYIGSPDLHEQLLLWLEDNISPEEFIRKKTEQNVLPADGLPGRQGRKEKTELSLVKYMARSCSRCTPYGLFASCSAGKIAEKTKINLAGCDAVRRHGRLDMDYVCEALKHLLQQKEISEQLLFFPNTSLYPLGDQLRYIEHRFQEKTGRSYHLVQVDRSDYIEKILARAAKGATPEQLAGCITDDEISPEEAQEFIYELVSAQVLVSELEPTITGEEYFSILLGKLKQLQHTSTYVTQFEKVAAAFREIRSPVNPDKRNCYPSIVQALKELGVPLHLKTLVQVDSYRPAPVCSLGNKMMNELMRGLSVLGLLNSGKELKDSFADFKNAFRDRYESQWIPLVEILDTESGIGYGKFVNNGMEESPLIDKLPLGNGRAINGNPSLQDAESFKWQLYQEAIRENRTAVQIDEKIIEQFSGEEPSAEGLPDSSYLLFKLHAGSAEEIDNGNYTIELQAPFGPSGANLLGRFCQLDPAIEEMSRSILKEEENKRPDCIFAEIVHLPESRIGNILMRPVLRNYEIPYLCGSTVDEEFRLPVTDLLVGVRDNRVVLHSKRLNKEILPRMTTAHNFSMTTLPVYQFLCDLQQQQIRQFGWQWGILENRPFLPRVQYGKYIFSKARWILTKEEMKDCMKKNDEEIPELFSARVTERNLPEYVLLAQGDNELLLHLKNPYCRKLLLSELNKAGTVTLTETFDRPDQCWIQGADGTHAGEFVIAFHKKINPPGNFAVKASDHRNRVIPERLFPVGSEWLYGKIYCGTKTAEKILVELIKPFTDQLLAERIIDRFFYIRFLDPGHHIRIRFHGDPQTGFWKEIIERLNNLLRPFLQNHTVSNIQFETYQREVERYGVDTMLLSEEIFYYQSIALLNFLSLLNGDEGEQYRWQIALKAIDQFLDDFGYSLVQKRDLVKSFYKNFSDEFKFGMAERKKISERFSTNRKKIAAVLGNGWEEEEDLARGIRAIQTGDPRYGEVIREIRAADSVGDNPGQLNNLQSSYLHMYINRIFLSNQRKVELVIYDHLEKYYESRIAIEKTKKETGAAVSLNTAI